MVSLKRLFKDHTDSGALHTLVNVFGFVDQEVLLTKSGDVALVLSLKGPDAESVEPEELDGISSRLTSALRAFSDSFVVSLYWIKRSNPPVETATYAEPFVEFAEKNRRDYLTRERGRFFSFETYLVITLKPNWPHDGFRERLARLVRHPKSVSRKALSVAARAASLRQPLEDAVSTLRHAVNSFVEQVKDDFSVRILSKGESFTFLRRLLNPDREKADAVSLKHDTHVDYFAVDSELACHRNYLRLGNAFIKIQTLKELPARSFAHILRDLCRVQADMVVVTEWNPLDQVRAVGKVKSKRRHFNNTKVGFQFGSERPYEREVLYDEAKEALAADLGLCLEKMEMEGLQLGDFSWTVMSLGETLEAVERTRAEVARVVGAHEGIVNEETINGLNAFVAMPPGGYPFNLRKLTVSNRNHVDLGLWFTASEGERRNAFLGSAALAVFETEEQSLYHFNLHVEDVGHTLILGPTGKGKSFIASFLIGHFQKYQPFTFILDVGGSYRGLTELLKGSYISFGPDARPVAINPYALEPTQANLEFQFLFTKFLVELQDGVRMSDAEAKDSFDAIQALQLLPPAQRRLKTLAMTVMSTTRKHLLRWTEGEQYGAWFDNAEDNVSYAKFQCIDFEGVERIGLALEPLLFYLLHRANEKVASPALATAPKLALLDEAWVFFKHPVTRAYIETALRTWRKKNASMVLATQSLQDLSVEAILRPIVDNCPTKLLLANPTLDAAFYGDVLRLTPTDQDKIRQLRSKGQFLLKRDGISKILNLNVDPKSYWLFTTNPYEVKRRQEAIDQYGLEGALDYLTGGSK